MFLISRISFGCCPGRNKSHVMKCAENFSLSHDTFCRPSARAHLASFLTFKELTYWKKKKRKQLFPLLWCTVISRNSHVGVEASTPWGRRGNGSLSRWDSWGLRWPWCASKRFVSVVFSFEVHLYIYPIPSSSSLWIPLQWLFSLICSDFALSFIRYLCFCIESCISCHHSCL